MLTVFQNLALCHLWKSIKGFKPLPDNLRQWFVQTKKDDPGLFFPFLVEPSGKIEKYYTLSQSSEDSQTAVLESAATESLGSDSAVFLPFNKPIGPRSPQLGPVIKRSFDKKKGAGPTFQITLSTLKSFKTKSETDKEWSGYFAECYHVFNCKKLVYEQGLKHIQHRINHLTG